MSDGKHRNMKQRNRLVELHEILHRVSGLPHLRRARRSAASAKAASATVGTTGRDASASANCTSVPARPRHEHPRVVARALASRACDKTLQRLRCPASHMRSVAIIQSRRGCHEAVCQFGEPLAPHPQCRAQVGVSQIP